jgi:hypothetical protein
MGCQTVELVVVGENGDNKECWLRSLPMFIVPILFIISACLSPNVTPVIQNSLNVAEVACSRILGKVNVLFVL